MKKSIIKLLKKELNLSTQEISNLIEIPPKPELGDYAFPCFLLAKKLKRSPVDTAKETAKKLKTTRKIDKISVVGPYINFFINKKLMAEQIVKINNDFGKKKNKEKILLEHTSVNPNASPHVGNMRNSIIGDFIKRTLEFSGYKLETHFYINDVSKQVAMLALVLAQEMIEKFGGDHIKEMKRNFSSYAKP